MEPAHILHPYHKSGRALTKFDYIVSNPPFKMDFSDYRDDLDTKANNDRFFAGLPNIPPKKKESMAIYQLFLQHIMYSMRKHGFVPSGKGLKTAICPKTPKTAKKKSAKKKIKK